MTEEKDDVLKDELLADADALESEAAEAEQEAEFDFGEAEEADEADEADDDADEDDDDASGLWPGDTGELPFNVRRVLVALLQGRASAATATRSSGACF